MKRRVLIVDDDESQRSAMTHLLSGWGFEALAAVDGRDALAKLADFEADAIITDLNMPNLDGTGLLAELQKTAAPPPTIVLTAFGSVEKAVEVVRESGAFWYLEKPVQARVLHTILERAVAQAKLAQHSQRLERQLSVRGELGGLVAQSAAMRRVFAQLEQAAPTKATILIGGETGTGKEVASRAIHDLSPRRGGPFLAMNCAALPDTLIESELFGHEKGAFTGAADRRAGYFELANGGTLLLDEIGEMPISTQAKLLRVLEDRKIRRLGGAREIEVDVRIVAATNRDLREGIAKGTFREDLYFRLNVFEVHLPALRERREDIPLIARSLIESLNRKHECRVTDIAPDVEALFAEYPWGGNVRELRNVLERAVILAGEGVIQRSHLPAGFAGLPGHLVESASGEVTLRPGVTVDEAERRLILMTLKHTNGNRARAAELLGLSVKTLFNKLKLYNEPGEPEE
ncbi:MAG TPA: sigma-54 dependent transcriptional regulator [Bryobacteraceae bacterium]|nr:sigma-54 dependent transcriptional regulator [Bryobacteraceae bacterium]